MMIFNQFGPPKLQVSSQVARPERLLKGYFRLASGGMISCSWSSLPVASSTIMLSQHKFCSDHPSRAVKGVSCFCCFARLPVTVASQSLCQAHYSLRLTREHHVPSIGQSLSIAIMSCSHCSRSVLDLFIRSVVPRSPKLSQLILPFHVLGAARRQFGSQASSKVGAPRSERSALARNRKDGASKLDSSKMALPKLLIKSNRRHRDRPPPSPISRDATPNEETTPTKGLEDSPILDLTSSNIDLLSSIVTEPRLSASNFEEAAPTTTTPPIDPTGNVTTFNPLQPPPIHSKLPWQSQKAALLNKFGTATWSPRKRLSPDALSGIRALHAQYPLKYTTPVLAAQFQISPEAIRRILKSKWTPSEEEDDDRRQRWEKRGEKIWNNLVDQGLRKSKVWGEEGRERHTEPVARPEGARAKGGVRVKRRREAVEDAIPWDEERPEERPNSWKERTKSRLELRFGPRSADRAQIRV